ncbi:MAG: amidohydrolase family protein [Spirochaetales bacterium]|nr:amidohydrolase family protein [Spirochaetales bacterium]
MEEKQYFFDCHCHTMTLAQPNLTSFLENIFHNAAPDLLRNLASETNFNHHQGPRQGLSNIMNLAALVQNDLDGIFSIMEDDLKGRFGGDPLADEQGLNLGGHRYDGLIITPLLMDFKTLPDAPNSTYYPQPQKDLQTVINEYAYGIRKYYKKRPRGLLQIYPFLGINTAAYSYKKVEKLLLDSFSFYRGDLSHVRKSRFFTLVAGKLAPSRMFGGIKLYPPMGFDPWPEEKEERKKVRLLYEFAQLRKIPLTVHCNDGGYITIDYKKARLFTSPDRWIPVLENYPELIVNLAHMGYREETVPEVLTRKWNGRKEPTWTEKIFDLIERYPHVYTDFSFNGIKASFYKTLHKLLAEQGSRRRVIEDKILFGTDFMINLSSIPSYRDYYRRFDESPLNRIQKNRFGSINPRRFLHM